MVLAVVVPPHACRRIQQSATQILHLVQAPSASPVRVRMISAIRSLDLQELG